MSGGTIGKDECRSRRAQLISEIRSRLEDDNDWLDSLMGWNTTLEDVIKLTCCNDEPNGCDCEELLQWYKDQCAVIEGIESYLQAGDFSKNWRKATTVTAATVTSAGIRPNVSCCLKAIIDKLEATTTSLSDDFAPTQTGWEWIYISKVFLKASWSGDKSEYYKASAEIELGRSRRFRKMIFDVYSLCCCKD